MKFISLLAINKTNITLFHDTTFHGQQSFSILVTRAREHLILPVIERRTLPPVPTP